MFVSERMSRPVITLAPDTPVHDALDLFRKEHIRRAPVVKDGKVIGIVSASDLLNASPSPISSLSVWEMNYLLAKVTVRQVMSKKVVSVEADTPIEEAARIMADKKIGGLPVMRADKLVGIITETDLFKAFLELMGARAKALRVTAEIEDKPGALAQITKAVADAGGNFVSLGQFSGNDSASKVVVFKAAGVKEGDLKKALGKAVKKFWDIRQS